LKACVLFFIDISETCSYSIENQVKLYLSIKSLFSNKPHIVVLTKVDLKKYEDLTEHQRNLIENLKQSEGVIVVPLSNQSGEGIEIVKKEACEALLKFRAQFQTDVLAGSQSTLKKEEDFLRGTYVARPKK
jgi:nucleolar GTP-binding protein